jgi:hypothetical protein
MRPPWQRIASSFPNRATIPYLLKAMRIQAGADDSVSADECRSELYRLLATLCEDPPEPHLVGLELCPTIDAVVVCVEKQRVKNYARIPPLNQSGRGLYHAIGFKGSDLASLADMLWRQHDDVILERRFSREPIEGADHNEHEWVPFSPSETERVRRILGMRP